MSKAARRVCGVAASAALAATAAMFALAGTAVPAVANTPAPSAACNLGNGVKHVIQITFDNVHYNRDNPNVLSDLEQMPALLNFITGNGTLLSNNHTPLIAHTADDTLTNYSGLYGDRQGQGITNSYETYGPGGTVTSKSSFAYWTGTYGLDSFPNQPYSAKVPAAGSPPASPPAPWVPFTRAGCDVGDVSTANMELENLNPDLANVFGATSPEVVQLNADSDSFKDQEANDYEGLGVHCAHADSFCTSAQAVKFGQTTPAPSAVTDSLPNEPSGYAGFQAVFGHRYLQPQLASVANAGGGDRVVGGHTYEVTDAHDGGQRRCKLLLAQQRLRVEPRLLRPGDRQHVARPGRSGRAPCGRGRLERRPGPELGRHCQLEPAAGHVASEPRDVGRPHRHPADDHGPHRPQGRLHRGRTGSDRGSHDSPGTDRRADLPAAGSVLQAAQLERRAVWHRRADRRHGGAEDRHRRQRLALRAGVARDQAAGQPARPARDRHQGRSLQRRVQQRSPLARTDRRPAV